MFVVVIVIDVATAGYHMEERHLTDRWTPRHSSQLPKPHVKQNFMAEPVALQASSDFKRIDRRTRYSLYNNLHNKQASGMDDRKEISLHVSNQQPASQNCCSGCC